MRISVVGLSRKEGAKLYQDTQGGPNTAHVVVKNIDIRIHQSLRFASCDATVFFDGWFQTFSKLIQYWDVHGT